MQVSYQCRPDLHFAPLHSVFFLLMLFFFFFMERENFLVLFYDPPSLLSIDIVVIVRRPQRAWYWHHWGHCQGHQCWELSTNLAVLTTSLAWWQSCEAYRGMGSMWQLHLLFQLCLLNHSHILSGLLHPHSSQSNNSFLISSFQLFQCLHEYRYSLPVSK